MQARRLPARVRVPARRRGAHPRRRGLAAAAGLALTGLLGPDAAAAPPAAPAAQAASALPAASAAPAEDLPIEPVRSCAERSAPQRNSVARATLRAVAADGGVRESKARIWWERGEDRLSQLLVRFSAPRDLRGSALLVLEKPDERADMFMYLPELGRVRRVTARMMSGSMFGTDLSYEDLQRLYGILTHLDSRRLPDSALDGRAVYVVQSIPDDEARSAYERIVHYVEQERCVPLRIELFETGDAPRKVMRIDPETLRARKQAWVPAAIEVRDLRSGSLTTLELEEVRVDVDLPQGTFSQSRLGRGR